MRDSAAPRRADDPGSGERVAFLDQALWRRLAEAEDEHDYLVAWLTLQCRMVSGCQEAVVLLHEQQEGILVPTAAWPESASRAPSEAMSHAVDSAVAQRAGAARSLAEEGRDSLYAVALPVFFDEELEAVVAMEVACPSRELLPEVMRRLQWGTAWLEALLWRRRAEGQAQHRERIEAAFDLLAPLLDARRLRDAADSLTSELASRLGAQRASLGMLRRGRVRVISLSHTAAPDTRMREVRAIAAAMDEALDQEATLVHPPPPGQVLATLSHAEMLSASAVEAVVSVPLFWGEQAVGAITLEFEDASRIDSHLLDVLEAVAAAAAPVLDSRRRNDRWLLGKAWDSLVAGGAALLGPRHLVGKALALLLVALGSFLWFGTGDFRVTSDALIEGSVQRTLAAPFDGYVAEVSVRPGDLVEEGEALARLDATDQELELLHWRGMERQNQLEYERALAEGDRSAVAVAGARLDQATAQADLALEQIRRSTLVAPFDAYVLSGDLSRSVGVAMSRGEPMLELAPLAAYRVVLMVGEQDIDHIESQQSGRLVLASAPEQPLDFEVERITAVSEPGDGENRFRVEGVIEDREDLTRLRPGMEGVAKVMVDERRLAWIWSHRIIDWFRLKLWRWWP